MRSLVLFAAATTAIGAASSASAAPSFSQTLQAVCGPLLEKKSTVLSVPPARQLGYSVSTVRDQGKPGETLVLGGPLGTLEVTEFNGGECTLVAPTDSYKALITEFNGWAAKAPHGPYQAGEVGADKDGQRLATWTSPSWTAAITEDLNDAGHMMLFVSLEATKPR